MSELMNRSQEVLYDICIAKRLVCAKAVGHRLHKGANYISDLCRRERVDFMAVFNEVLQEAESLVADEPERQMAVAQPINRLLHEGTCWVAQLSDPINQFMLEYDELIRHTGVLLKDLGGALDSLARIEADRQYDEQDDVSIDEFMQKVGLLTTRLNSLVVEVNKRRLLRHKL